MKIRYVVKGQWHEYESPTGDVLPPVITLPVWEPGGSFGQIRLDLLAVERGIAVYA